jgi:hypothetical protein
MKKIFIVFISLLFLCKGCISDKKRNISSEVKIEKDKKIEPLLNRDFNLIDKNDFKIHISDLFKKYDKLVILRFTDLNCDSCYKSVLMILDKYKEYDNIFVFSSFRITRNFKIFLMELNTNLKIFNLEENVFKDLNVPYFFTLNKSLEVDNILLHNKKNPKKTIEYLETILKNEK